MAMNLSYPLIDPNSVGWITEEQMIEVDRVMIHEYGIVLLQMMENAGRNLARVVLDSFAPSSVAIVSGSGGNGGGGMVAARHLANAGIEVSITTSRDPHDLTGVPAAQFDILQQMGVRHAESLPADALVIDALIGYSLRGAPRGRTGDLIDAMDGRIVVALDSPSGVDVTTGDIPGVAVNAAATMTLCLPKTGLRNHRSVGELLLADISVPPAVTGPLGGTPNFAASPVLHVDAKSG